jgi:EAL domain-containing protein (putative c-di-GMP-specific phosphodiesterase class I)
LLRWQHPELGLMSPAQFITVAEETGEIISIGKWVLRMACHQAKTWQSMGCAKLYVAVNLSARQFREPDLVHTVEQALEVTGLAPEYLHLEVTESSIMEDPEQAIAKMQRLRAQGIHFSIDDFGIGYSSLSYLKRFPIDTLKIDRSFVMEAATNTDDQEIIRVIIAMARNLRLALVAEGVETKAQHNFLSRQGCHIMQGYYFGRPMSTDQFEHMLHKREIACEEQNAVDIP